MTLKKKRLGSKWGQTPTQINCVGIVFGGEFLTEKGGLDHNRLDKGVGWR